MQDEVGTVIQQIHRSEGRPAVAGVFADDGARTVWARVMTGNVPDLVPADLRPHLVPVREPVPGLGPDSAVLTSTAGPVLDWALRPGFAAAGTERDAVVVALADWRRGFVREWALGPLAQVRSLISWADRRVDVATPRLRGLLALPVRVDTASAVGLAREVGLVADACRGCGDLGVGFSVDGRPGLARAVLPETAGVVLLAGARAHLRVDGPAVTLVRTPRDEAASASLLDRWSLSSEGVTVRGGGHEQTLPLDDPAARLLAAFVPGAGAVSVHPVPATSVFADALVNLPRAALRAAGSARALTVAL